MIKKDYTFESDYIIGYECDCGYYDTDTEEAVCHCGRDIEKNYTSHESCSCGNCGKEFDMWEDGYVNDSLDMICKSCYSQLD